MGSLGDHLDTEPSGLPAHALSLTVAKAGDQGPDDRQGQAAPRGSTWAGRR